MSKNIDSNGFWLIKDNPISLEGCYPYIGNSIRPDLESNKLYSVYRPAQELEAMALAEKDDAIPFFENHIMVGDGFTPVDEKPAQGVLFNIRYIAGKVIGDLKIFSEKLKEAILAGKKALSLGYTCIYEPKSGEWNGKAYDFIQRELSANHLALVDRGRMGDSVVVYDSKDGNPRMWAMDTIDLVKTDSSKVGFVLKDSKNKDKKMDKDNKMETSDEFVSIEDLKRRFNSPEDLKWLDENKYKRNKTKDEAISPEGGKKAPVGDEKSEVEETKKEGKMEEEDKKVAKDEGVDKRDAIRQIMAIAAKKNDDFKGGEAEKIETIAKLAEKISYNKSSRGTANDESEEDKKKEKEEGKDKKSAMDAEDVIRIAKEQLKCEFKAFRELTKKVEKVSDLQIACDSFEDVESLAKAVCEKAKLGLDNAQIRANTYLDTMISLPREKTFALDESVKANSSDEATRDFLENIK